MNIDISKINEIYGKEMIENIKENIQTINKNINYLICLEFINIEDLVERLTPLFLNDYSVFKDKIDSIIKKIGINYAEEIDEDISILEELLY